MYCLTIDLNDKTLKINVRRDTHAVTHKHIILKQICISKSSILYVYICIYVYPYIVINERAFIASKYDYIGNVSLNEKEKYRNIIVYEHYFENLPKEC